MKNGTGGKNEWNMQMHIPRTLEQQSKFIEPSFQNNWSICE